MKKNGQKWSLESHPLYQDRNLEINWLSFWFHRIDDIRVRNSFQNSCKEFATIYLSDVIAYGENPSPGTLGNRTRLFRTLVRWMIENQTYRFAELTGPTITRFFNENISGKKLTKKHIRKYIHVFEKLWDYRGQYTKSVKVDPRTLPILYELLEQGKELNKWNAVPIDDAVPLIKDALLYFQEQGRELILVLNNIASNRGSFVGLTHTQMRIRMRMAHQLARDTEAFRRLTNLLALPPDISTRVTLRKSINLAIAASLIVILFFTGLRCSEVLALKVGCYRRRKHKAGGNFWYIEGIQAKSGGMEREWVVPNPVVQVLSFLEELHCILMGSVENEYLFSLPDGNGILPPPFVDIRRLWTSTASDLLKLFAGSSLRSSPSIPNLHPHQARKTFARFVVLKDKSALEALAQHYGHLYTALLDGAYIGIDVELHELLSEEIERQVTEGLTELISATAVGGKAGVAFSKMRDEALEKFRGKTSITSVVRSMIDEGVVIFPCDWGYCVYIPELSACKGNELGPNLRDREPNACASCSNFAVTEKNREWWESRVNREEKFLESGNASEQAREIAKRRYEKSQVVLISLNKAEHNG